MTAPNFISKLLLSLTLVGSLVLTGCSSTASSSSNSPNGRIEDRVEPQEARVSVTRSKGHVKRTGEVYLMRGLLNVFSRGMDTLAGRMRSRGFDAVSFNHADWTPYAEDIVRRSKSKDVSYPIIIMGHSLGGNEAPRMANYLAARGIKTSLIVAFDPTEPQVVGKNIGSVVNYYLPNGRNTFSKAGGFKGKLQNITVDHLPGIKHTNVEKNTKLQNQSINHAMRITKKLKRTKSAKKRRSLRATTNRS